MNRSKKILSVLLYLVPVIFFIVCYFLIITSGEDIWQGAKSQVDIFGDAAAAFRHSVRLADMFAWSIINFFDYYYSFGADTILRLVDVLAAVSIFYMATYIALQRRPRLQLKDATVFCAIFLAVFLTSNGLTLYAGFSKIHNYLFITFFSLVFGIFYLRALWGRKIKNSLAFSLFMLVLGFLFGFASNVTAIVFLLAMIGYGIYLLLRGHRPTRKAARAFFLSWKFAGVLGILVSLYVMFFIGNGLGDYDTNPAYLTVCDYIPLSEIFANFFPSVGRLILHNLYNFGRFLLPFVVASVPIGIYALATRAKFKFKALRSSRNYLVAAVIFIFFHIFAMSQIYYPTRLVLPAYIFAVSVFVFIVMRGFKTAKASAAVALKFLPVVFLGLAIGVTAVRAYFATNYLKQVVPVLEEIRTTSGPTYCVDLDTATAKSLPYVHLAQEDFLVDWAMPQTIYGKTVTYCEN